MAESRQAQDKPSLYSRLGGVYSIATVIDDFIDRIMVDPRLNANPRVDEAHHRVQPAGFKYLVTEMLCWAAGGPQRYTGRTMEESHRHLLITAEEWQAFMDDLQQTLDKFAVPAAEQTEVKALVESTRGDIVVGWSRIKTPAVSKNFRWGLSEMSIVGQVESLWRYPVKSMRGEELAEAFVGFSGVYGDRLFAFRSSARPEGFPYLTWREQEEMLLYRPRFCHPDKTARPPNLAKAEAMAPGLTPLFAAPAELAVEVETPTGEVLDVEDPALLTMLARRMREEHVLTLLRSERAMTDCRPVSLFSLQTARQLGDETGMTLDKRRFRADVYMDLGSAAGFAEDRFVGHSLRLGAKTVVAVLERDQRCKMITLDPETAEAATDLLRKVTRDHDGKAGIYGAVLVEGTVRPGGAIELLN